MGVVYLVRDRLHDREVALKAILDAGDEVLVERFVREARATAALEHPALVSTYELGRDGEGLHFTMRLVQGSTLSAAIRGGKRALPELVHDLMSVARGVAYAHARGLVHRDLKPDNVMVEADGSVQILDWGLVGASGGGAVPTTTSTFGDGDAKLTMAGELMGTPAYMSPEQAEGADDVGPASDVYSLGAILYEILTGEGPHAASSVREILKLVRAGNVAPPSARARGRDVPPELEAVCLRALQRRPRDRYATAADLADDLEAWLEGRTVSVLPPSWPVRLARFVGRHKVATFAAALLAVAVGGSTLFAVTESRNRAETRREKLAGEHARAEEVLVEARRLSEEWRALFSGWQAELMAESAQLSRAPEMPPLAPGEGVQRYRARQEEIIAGFDWIGRDLVVSSRSGQRDESQASLDRSFRAQAAAEEWQRARTRAEKSFERLGQAGHRTEGRPEPAEALAELAGQVVARETLLFLDVDGHEMTPEWSVAIPTFDDWAERAGSLPTHWKRLIDALWAYEAALRETGRDPVGDRVACEARAVLDGTAVAVVERVPPGWSATLYRTTGEPLWLRTTRGGVVEDPEAGLARVADVPAAGGTFPTRAGEHILRLQNGEAFVNQPFVLARGDRIVLTPDTPAEFAPGSVRVPPARYRVHRFYLEERGGYFLKRTEVTVAEFQEFLNAAGAANREFLPHWFSDDPPDRGRPEFRYPLALRDGRWQLRDADVDPGLPVKGLTYTASVAYARWLAERDGWDWRVPTLPELILAGQGVLARHYRSGLAIPARTPDAVFRWSIHGAIWRDHVIQWTSSAVTPNLYGLYPEQGIAPDRVDAVCGVRLLCRKRTR